jgi:hypothetical protein
MKPKNLLVFREELGVYKAKVIDFGYSCRYSDENKAASRLPMSWPWNAPEHDRRAREWNFLGVKKTDVFFL